MTTPTTGPLTEARLRRIAEHYVHTAVRDTIADRMGLGEMIDTAIPALQLDVDPDEILDDPAVREAVVERIAELLRTAAITVEWPAGGAS